MDIQSLIDHPSKLPTVERVAQRVIASMGSEDVTSGEIGQLISADPVLSAKLLRLANSSYFQMARTIETVEDAIRVLGFGMVRNLVLTGSMVRAFANTPGMELHQFWKYSLYTACTARWLAAPCKVNSDLVFTLGLIHGIGQLHMHLAAPAAIAALDQQLPVLADGRAALETQAFGFHFCDVSAALAQLWNFPMSLVQAMSPIPSPLAVDPFSIPAAVVHLGAWHARCEVFESTPAAKTTSYPLALSERLGLSPSWYLGADANPMGDQKLPPIPAMAELTHGLEQMLD